MGLLSPQVCAHKCLLRGRLGVCAYYGANGHEEAKGGAAAEHVLAEGAHDAVLAGAVFHDVVAAEDEADDETDGCFLRGVVSRCSDCRRVVAV